MMGCSAYITTLAADTAKLQGLLPEGYIAKAAVGNVAPVSAAVLTVFFCDSAVFGNQSVVRDLAFAHFHNSVGAPEGVRSPDPNRPDHYVYELVVNSQVGVDAFEAVGFHATLGALTRQAAVPTLHYRIEAGSQALYDFQGWGETDASPGLVLDALRLHQGVPEGVWANLTEHETLSSAGSNGALSLGQGVGAAVAYNALATAAAHVTIGRMDMTWEFSC